MTTGQEWHQYLGGAWTPATDGRTRNIVSPWDGRTVGVTSVSTLADAERAVAAAQEAFARTRALAAHERHAILRRIYDGLAARREEFAQGICDEAGKPIRDARGEVDRALLVFSLAADEARRLGGDVLPLDMNAASAGRVGITRRFPAGPVAALTPFNFPLNLVAHKIAPAIAAGCPVVLKPAEKTPLSALRLASLVHESGWPAGGFSVLTPESPAEIGNLLATDDRLRVLSFTGSDKVGWELKAKANRKRVLLELGGNAAVIVHEDADLAYSVARCVVGAFANAGQVCISVQRIFVHRPIWDSWTTRFLDGVRSLKTGDPSDESTDIGPMISAQAADKTESLIRDGITGGAKALLAGERRGPTVLSPTVLTGTSPEMAICRDEAFGPVVVIEPYDTFEEAIARANEGRFGLQAGVFTRDVGRLFQAFGTLEVGGVIANDVPQYRVDNMPYGGERDSGFGREGIAYAIEEMTELRLLALNFPPQTAA